MRPIPFASIPGALSRNLVSPACKRGALLLLGGTLLCGAVRAQLVVTSNADNGPGSLRQALADAAAAPGGNTISFAPAVFTGSPPLTNTILLASTLVVDDPNGVVIDGSELPVGVSLSGAQSVRIFANEPDSRLTLRGLTLTAGNSAGASGGAVRNQGWLRVRACCLHGNTAGTGAGGAIASSGSGNTLILENTTVTGNTAGIAALHLTASSGSSLTHCTVARNHGTVDTGGGGGVVLNTGSSLAVRNSIIAGNTAAGTSPPDINGGAANTLTMVGVNLIGVRAGGLQSQLPAGLPNADGNYIGTASDPVDPNLESLGKNRGPTPGLMPRASSLVLDRILDPPFATDQSGQPRVDHGRADIGALEGRFVLAESAWDVRFSWKDGMVPTTAAAAGQSYSVTGATHRAFTAEVVAFHDEATSPQSRGHFLHRQRPWPINNQTPNGLLNGDDNAFHLHARRYFRVTAGDDYTFGFSSDDGAQLRVFATDGSSDPVFVSSTPLNPVHPLPSHAGNTLRHDGITSASDTLGVIHLTAGVYRVEFDMIEVEGLSHAEVFAAPGARMAVDGSFRLLGDEAPPLSLNPPALTDAGWAVQVFRRGSTSLAAGIAEAYKSNGGTHLLEEVMSLRFTTGPDHPERDPMTFVLEGSLEQDEWVILASGNTQLPTSRLARGPLLLVQNASRYKRLRLHFPTVRDAALATAMQVGEVEMFTAFDSPLIGPFAPVHAYPSATLANQGPSNVLDGDPSTVFAHPSVLDTGFVLIPGDAGDSTLALATTPTLLFRDPESFDPAFGHGLAPAPFPGNRAGDDDRVTTVARAMLRIDVAGDYTFCAEADDDVRVRIVGSRGWTAITEGPGTVSALVDGFQCLGAGDDVIGQVRLLPGHYEVEVFHHDTLGEAGLGLWGASGRHPRFDGPSSRYFGLLGSVPVGAVEAVPSLAPTRAPDSARPVNDDFAHALELQGTNVLAWGANVDAGLESSEPTHMGPTRTVWWKWTAPTNGPVHMHTLGSKCDTILALYTGDTLESLSFRDGRTFSIFGDAAELPFDAIGGTTYWFQVGVRAEHPPGRIRLALRPGLPPANDHFASAINLGNQSPVTARGDILGATVEEDEEFLELISGNWPVGNVWFRWTAPTNATFLIDARGSGFAAGLGVYTGTSLSTLSANHRRVGHADNSDYCLLEAVAGTTYWITVDAWEGSGSTYALNIARVGHYGLFSSRPLLEDEGGLLLGALGDEDYQRTPRMVPRSSAPTILPLGNVQFFGLSTVVVGFAEPAPDQFGSAIFSHDFVFDRIPASLSLTLTFQPVNDAPEFLPGANPSTFRRAPQSLAGWATAIHAGPANESGQSLGFQVVANDNPALFSTGPSVSPDGALAFTAAPGKAGTARLTLRLRDNGGTADDGEDFRDASFQITINPHPYDTWAASHYGAVGANRGAYDDFDGNGVLNLLDYALLGPLSLSAQAVRFTRWRDADAAGLRYEVQESGNLHDWIASPLEPLADPGSGASWCIAYPVSPAWDRRFFRLAIFLLE